MTWGSVSVCGVVLRCTFHSKATLKKVCFLSSGRVTIFVPSGTFFVSFCDFHFAKFSGFSYKEKKTEKKTGARFSEVCTRCVHVF